MISLYFSTETYDLASCLIRYVTRSPWSHVGFFKGGRTFSAMFDGVKWGDMDEKANMLIINPPGVEQAFEWALTQEGKPYDRSAIFGMALDRDWHDPRKWYCSELVAEAFEITGNPLFNINTQVYRITPRDILLSKALN